MKTLQELEPGDAVVISRRASSGMDTGKVVRKTATRIVVERAGYMGKLVEDAFLLRNGRRVGDGSFSHCYVRVATPELLAAEAHRTEMRILRERVASVNIGGAPLDHLRAVEALYVKLGLLT